VHLRSEANKASSEKQNKESSICFFLPNLDGGGAEKIIIGLANALADEDYTVTICVGSKEGSFKNRVTSRVSIVDLQSSRISKAVFKLAGYLRKTEPHVLISTLTHANIVAATAVLIARSRTRLVLREAIATDQNLYQPKAGQLVLRVLAAITYRRADTIVCLCNEMLQPLTRFLHIRDISRYHVIPNYADPQLDKLRLQPCKSLSSLPDRFIVAVGRLHKQKGFDILISAYTLLRKRAKKGDNIPSLVILGEGPERSSLEALAKSQGISDLYMPGFVSNPYPIVNKAIAFVLSSRYEGFPNALIDAVSMRKPVVSTRCPTGPSEILETQDNAWLVDVENEEQMAEALYNMLLSNLDGDATGTDVIDGVDVESVVIDENDDDEIGVEEIDVEKIDDRFSLSKTLLKYKIAAGLEAK